MQILHQEASRIYGNLDMLASDISHNSIHYNFKCVSVFDHKLTNDEADKRVIFYQQAMEKGDTPSSRQYYKYHHKFVKFYHNLYVRTLVYRILCDSYNNSILVTKFDSVAEFISYVIPSIRSQTFQKILLPEFFSVIEGNFDLVHLLYTLKSRSRAFESISSIILSNGLFVGKIQISLH